MAYQHGLVIPHPDDAERALVIELSEDCASCGGKGKYVDFERERFVRCGPCQGRGRKTTRNGDAVLAFLQEYGQEVRIAPACA